MRTISVLLLIFFFFQPTHDESTNAVKNASFGYINGQFNVTDAGSALYAIPLSLSPGTAGMAPELSIVYNSQGGNGILGNGWSLLGLSSISRSGKTLSQDNEIRGVKLDGADTYSLDGERLVLVNGTYGANGSEYRTEQNAFLKVVSYGNTSGSPEKFKVWTTSGLVMEYGFTDNSRVEVQESGKIVFWLVNKIQDTKGNYILFNYEKDITNGDYRPISIEYTGNINTGLAPYNTVQFFYEDRPDNIPRYILGRKIQTNKILKSVKSFHGYQLAREYRFDYIMGNYSGICLLSSVTECGTDGACLEPTVFKWKEEPEIGFTPINTIPNSELDNDNITIFEGDWDGNGLVDFMRFNTSTGANKFYINSGGLNFTTSTDNNPITPADLLNGFLFFGDFDANGTTDIVWHDLISGESSWYINQGYSAGDLSFQKKTNIIPNGDLDPINASNVNLYFADWNGDGRTDLLAFHASTGTNRFYLNNSVDGNNLSFTLVGTSNLIPSNLISGSSNLYLIDWNGDGLLDILWYKKDLGTTKWFGNTGNGINLSFSAPVNNPIIQTALQGGDGIQFGDWNGDGLVDLMWHNQDNGTSRWYFNKGNLTFLEATHDLDASQVSSYQSLYLLDVNGDGYDDAVLYDQDTGNNRWLLNDGRCHFNGNANIPNAIPPGSIDHGTVFSFGGFSGEGIVDAFWYDRSNGQNSFFRSKSRVSNLVDTIVAGNGFTIAIDYRPLTDEELYTKENTAVYPEYDFQNRMYVVCSYMVDNGIGGVNKMSYQYKGAKLNLRGRGFRGFTEVHIKDETTGVTSSKYMNRDYRYIGSPLLRAETRLADGTLISETENKDTLLYFYNNNNDPLSTHFAYTYQSTSKTYELDGSMVSNRAQL